MSQTAQTCHTLPERSATIGAGSQVGQILLLGQLLRRVLDGVYARYIPNRTPRDGSDLMHHMEGTETDTNATEETAAVLPKYPR